MRARSGKVRSLARMGFIDRGRGAIWLNLVDGKQGLSYLSREAWEHFELVEERRTAVFNSIDTYEPLTQAVVVAFSHIGNDYEVTTCLIKLALGDRKSFSSKELDLFVQTWDNYANHL